MTHSFNQDVCESQEAWWLRKGCRRARCRLIKSLADCFHIPVQSIEASFYFILRMMASACSPSRRVKESSSVKACTNMLHRLQRGYVLAGAGGSGSNNGSVRGMGGGLKDTGMSSS